MAFSLKDFSGLEKIGIGGMGDVYSATQISASRRVVLKKIGAELEQHLTQVKQFEKEANTIQRIQHDNIIRIYTHGYEDGAYYLVMEYVNGPNLEHLLQTSRFSTELGLMIVQQALKGLQYAHRNGVAHCDIKPGNMLVGRNGTVKLSDFGMAHTKVHYVQNERIRTVFATPLYMPPEQAAIIQKQDLESEMWAETNHLAATDLPPDQAHALQGKAVLWDIWSVGVLLYRICGDRMPFTGDTLAGLTHSIVRTKEKDISQLAPQLPVYLAEVIHACLQKEPEKRAASLDPVIFALEQYLSELQATDTEAVISQYIGTLKEFSARDRASRRPLPGLKRMEYPVLRLAGFLRSNRVLAAGAALLFLLLCIAGMFSLGHKKQQHRPAAVALAAAAPVARAKPKPQPVPQAPAAPAETAVAVPPAPPAEPESAALTMETPRDTENVKPQKNLKEREKTAAQKKRPEKIEKTAKAEKSVPGMLKATIEPPGAMTYVDGKAVANRLLVKGRQLPAGDHQIVVQANGFETFQQTVTIEPKTTFAVAVNLTPQEKGTGFLHVYSYPWAQVFVDYTLVGTSPTPNPIPLTEGEHTLQLKREGFKSYQESVLVLKDQTTRIQVNLEKVKAAAAPEKSPQSIQGTADQTSK